MNYSIKKERLNKFIFDYISDTFVPDYGWVENSNYMEDVKIWGETEFYVNDNPAYSYHKSFKGYNNILIISQGIDDILTGMFGNLWVQVFKDWFTKNTSLTVQLVGTYNLLDVRLID